MVIIVLKWTRYFAERGVTLWWLLCLFGCQNLFRTER